MTSLARGQEDTVRLASLWDSMAVAPGDSLLASRFGQELRAYLQRDGFEARIPALRGLGDVRMSDARLLTWGVRATEGEWWYMGLLIARRKGGHDIYSLRDRRIPVGDGVQEEEWLTQPGDSAAWLGAYYYQGQSFKTKEGEKGYILIGIAGGNMLVTRRVIEVMRITERGPSFGDPLIRFGKYAYGRLLFSHGARVGMEMRFLKGNKRILLDHLSPGRPYQAGLFQFYGPDFSYDALNFNGNEWLYESNVDVRHYVPARRF